MLQQTLKQASTHCCQEYPYARRLNDHVRLCNGGKTVNDGKRKGIVHMYLWKVKIMNGASKDSPYLLQNPELVTNVVNKCI